MMAEENKDNEALEQNGEIDPVAMEAARELSPELLERAGEILTSTMVEDEQNQKVEELLAEMNIRINEIYQRKKQGKSN